MSKEAVKAKDNIYYQARIRASKFNESFKNRDLTAEQLNIHPSTLARYELGILPVNQEIVILMSELYNDPSLISWFCNNECLIGKLCYKKNVCNVIAIKDD
ncbi:hypothetical protein SH1V18_15280 [Vallitalea longa]|uniref:Uncharacterized protein n=1 Tax=Vallitalea longa TaxID=2936439 RepID=A0A9W5YAZ0_9FIRM|nr:helix-turn-helix transcriptional regulator [Vallitalea longa]GKX29048.1 hypothetical protein SH1V18_15280 [Vallitalea longa]